MDTHNTCFENINFSFLFHFSMKITSANRIIPDGMPRFAAFHLGLFCLPMSHKKDARLIWVDYMTLQRTDGIFNPSYSGSIFTAKRGILMES